MKFLCLAYGDEKDWAALSKEQQDELLAQDEVLRRRGDLVAVVEPPTVVRAWNGRPTLTRGPVRRADVPMVGFALIDARDLEEAVGLVAKTPCAVARGAIEIWPIVPRSGV